jgi:hypothetical protein
VEELLAIAGDQPFPRESTMAHSSPVVGAADAAQPPANSRPSSPLSIGSSRPGVNPEKCGGALLSSRPVRPEWRATLSPLPRRLMA